MPSRRRDSRPDPTRRMQLCKGVCAGMAALHRGGVLHLDLKPGNILISEHGVPWVADFGLAHRLESTLASSMGSSKGMRGTLPYMAPELFRGKKMGGPAYGKPCDVYSFAMVTWQTFTGEIPFHGKRQNDISTMHIMALLGQDDPERPNLDDDRVHVEVRYHKAWGTGPGRKAWI